MKGGNRQRGRVCQDETPGRRKVGAGFPFAGMFPLLAVGTGRSTETSLLLQFRHAIGTSTWCPPRLLRE